VADLWKDLHLQRLTLQTSEIRSAVTHRNEPWIRRQVMQQPLIDPGADHAPGTYRQVVHEVCTVFNLDSKALLQTGRLQIDGVTFSLMHYGPMDPEAMTVMVDLGEITPDRQLEVYRQFLEANVLHPASAGTYGLIPETGHGAMTMRLRLGNGEYDGVRLARLLGDLAQTYRVLDATEAAQGRTARIDADTLRSIN